MADKLTTYDQLEELAKRGSGGLAEVATATTEAIKELSDKIDSTVGAYTWYLDTDEVKDLGNKSYGTMAACQTDAFIGKWFYLCTTTSRSGSGSYPSKYTIAGANGKVSYGDYVMWTGSRLVHISINEAKSSDVKNSDGRYSSTGGVDGLMSSTDKAYLTDLINSFWGKTCIPVRHCKDSTDTNIKNGWLVNWCREDGWYIGGLGADCNNHPPYTGGNKVNWLLLVVNGMKGAESEDWYNLRVQVAFDVKNSIIYMRRGWINNNTWTTDGTDGWTRVGGPTYELQRSGTSLYFVCSDGPTTVLPQVVVPAPGTYTRGRFLRVTDANGNYGWETLNAATASADGLMSAADKAKLDSLVDGEAVAY